MVAVAKSVSTEYPYPTILFKLSGELLGGKLGSGIDYSELKRVSKEIAEVAAAGVKVGVVIGGGNFFRGSEQTVDQPISTVRSHQIGMLMTIANAIALEQAFVANGVNAVVQSQVAVPAFVQQFDGVSFENCLSQGTVVIFAGGTGNTHVTTDTAASLRAIGIGADILLKATDVDGIYNADPMLDATALKYQQLSYDEVIANNLAVMDVTSVALCRDHNLPIRVFNAAESGGIVRAGLGAQTGTLITREGKQC